MKKSDVQFHGLGMGYTVVPAVNIKVHGDPRKIELPMSLGGVADPVYDEAGEITGVGEIRQIMSDPGFTHEWIEALPERTQNGVWDLVCEFQFADLRAYAKEEVWPERKVEVWQEGRSGGWAYVDGIPDFDTWDAVELARWAKFAKFAKALVDDVPYQYVTSLYINEWEAQQQAIVDQIVNGG